MLLLYMEPPDAFVSLTCLLACHFVGVRPAEQTAWRMSCAAAVVGRELPELASHLASLGLELVRHATPRHAARRSSIIPRLADPISDPIQIRSRSDPPAAQLRLCP